MSETLAPLAQPVDRPAPADPADEVFGWFQTMLAERPVHRDEHDIWHVFRHADVTRILSDPVTFSSDDRAFIPRQADLDLFARGNFVNMDPPRHRTLRGLVSRVFTPRVVAGLAPRIARVTDSLLDEVAGQQRFDLVEALAYPLPVTVIAELLGVPASDLPQFRRWAEGLFSVQVDASAQPSDELVAELAPFIREMNGYLLEHIGVRRTRGGDDLLGRLVDARVDGQGLRDDEIVGFAGVLLLAGHITTTALLGNAALCLDRFPEVAAQARTDPALLPAVVEEVLRYRSPFPRVGRATTQDVEVCGLTIPARRLVMPWIGAANRDPVRFADPGRFDIHREGPQHLAFGHGIHFCLGAPLARLESRIALGTLMRRYREIAVDAASVEHHNPWAMVAVRRLPVHATA